MGRKATKASDNIFYQARLEVMEKNPEFSSREKASAAIGIDRTRLARIELSDVIPHQEEVKSNCTNVSETGIVQSILRNPLSVGKHHREKNYSQKSGQTHFKYAWFHQ